MQEFDFVAATTVADACQALAERGSRAIAGGTDVLPRLQRSLFPAARLIDITRLDELRFVRQQGDTIEIGALTRYTDVLASDLLQREAASLIEAVGTVGCPQTRYRGTVGGNIVNASPAGDTLPPLLTYDASLRLLRAGGERTLRLADFFLGPGQTVLQPGELLHTISFRRLPARCGTAFIKLGNRRGMNIAVASVAVIVALTEDGVIDAARVAFGSVAPTPRRSARAEALLRGQRPAADLFAAAGEVAQEDISPIGDVRARAAYRRHAAGQLLQRALASAVVAAAAERGRE